MSAPTLTQILQAASSEDANLRRTGLQQLEAAEKNSFPVYLLSLCQELGGEDRPENVRVVAATQIRNALVRTKNPEVSYMLGERWMTVPDENRQAVKNMVLNLLGSGVSQVRSQASRIVAAIASIEIPKSLWNDLIDRLLQSIMQTESPNIRQAGFQALGYVCEEVPGDALQAKSPLVLNAIATGLTVEEKNVDIKLAAIRALVNSMTFIKANFVNDKERPYIMNMIFTTVHFADVRVRVAAYSALVEVASQYYQHLSDFIGPIYQFTSNAIETEKDDVQRQAIEVWSALSEEEIAIQEEEAIAKEAGVAPTRKWEHYIERAFQQLGPILLKCLTQQAADINDDEWNLAKAASTCLGLCVNAGKDHIVPHVLPFIQTNIESKNWKFKEAAIMAYGAILDGPSREKLTPLVKQTLPLILQQMQDENPLVKDTTAWTLGRVCQFVPEALDTSMLSQLMHTCVNALGDQPRVAQKICYALHSLALAVKIQGNTSPLSHYLEGLLKALLQTANRADVTEGGFLLDIFEVINDLVRTAAPDKYELIGQLVPELESRLQKTLAVNAPSKEIEDVQASLCSTLSEIIRKLDKSAIVPQADTLMTYFVNVLRSKNTSTLAETLIAVGDIANRVGPDFKKYVQALKDILLNALAATDQIHLCIVATGLVGDISGAIGSEFFMIGDDVMKALLENLANRMIDRAIKPHIISAFADIALSLRDLFERYNGPVMNMLIQASKSTYQDPDEDTVDFLQNLRQSILEAYTGILSGLSDGGKKHSFAQPTQDMNIIVGLVDFFDLLMKEDNYLTDGILSAAAGLIGDMASEFGADAVKLFAQRPSVKFLIQQAINSRDGDTKKAGQWAAAALR